MTRCRTIAACVGVVALAWAVTTAQAQPADGGQPGADLEPASQDANTTRLFFGPTGRTLPAGHGYVGIYEVLLPFVQVGVTDWVTVGGGTPIFFGGDSGHPFWLTPKVRVFHGGGVDVAAGVLHFFNISDEGGGAGIAYGVATFGSPDAAVTIGTGWAYSRFEDQDGNAAVAMIGGEYRVGRRLKLITENYVYDGGGIVCAGVRFFGENLSADLGLASPVGVGELYAFPMVNFVWRFPSTRP